MRLSRSSPRMSSAVASKRFASAASRSTCIRKYTPPRRSRPSDIDLAPSACIQPGTVDAWFSATT